MTGWPDCRKAFTHSTSAGSSTSPLRRRTLTKDSSDVLIPSCEPSSDRRKKCCESSGRVRGDFRPLIKRYRSVHQDRERLSIKYPKNIESFLTVRGYCRLRQFLRRYGNRSFRHVESSRPENSTEPRSRTEVWKRVNLDRVFLVLRPDARYNRRSARLGRRDRLCQDRASRRSRDRGLPSHCRQLIRDSLIRDQFDPLQSDWNSNFQKFPFTFREQAPCRQSQNLRQHPRQLPPLPLQSVNRR